MLETALRSDWILAVADVAAQLKEDLARIPVTASVGQSGPAGDLITSAGRRLADETSRANRLNALRSADTRMQRVDPQYATRADSNLAHFLLPRPDTGLDPLQYGSEALKPGAPLNAIGVYVWYHISALQMASRLAPERPFSGRAPHARPRRALRRGVCAAFPRRHLRGRPRRRQLGRCVAAQGHARLLQPERDGGVHVEGARAHDRADGRCAHAPAGRRARRRFGPQEHRTGARCAAGRRSTRRPNSSVHAAASQTSSTSARASPFPTGRRPGGGRTSPYAPVLGDVLLEDACTGPRARARGAAALRAAKSGLSSALRIAQRPGVNGGFEGSQNEPASSRRRHGFRVGLGLEGALGDSGDGLAFLQLGVSADAASTNKFADTPTGAAGRRLSAAIPARTRSVDANPPALLPHPGRSGVAVADAPHRPREVPRDRRHVQQRRLLGWQQGWPRRSAASSSCSAASSA